MKLARIMLICCYSFICGLIPKKRRNNVIVLLFFGRIGDGVMFLDALHEYRRIYSTEKGYKLVIGCRKEIRALIEITGKYRDLIFIDINRDKLLSSLSYFFVKRREINSLKPETIIHVRENNAAENIFIHAISANDKVIYRSFRISYNSRLKEYFSTHTYSVDYRSDEICDQLTNYAELLRKLGSKNYKSKIPQIELTDDKDGSLPEKYIVVCPGASSEYKCWPLERYAEVIDYIFSLYEICVVVCGSSSEADTAEKLKMLIKKDVVIINKAGETDLKQWISIIKNAKLVLSNESASVHIAAATYTPSICIGEQTFGNMWLPYRPEVIREGDQLPKVVRSNQMDCSFCVKREFRYSEECKSCIERYGVKKCVLSVTTEMVKKAVDQFNNENRW